MRKFTLSFIILSLLICTTISAEKESYSINTKHHLGLRLGAWVHGGEDAPEIYFDPTDSLNILETAFKDGNFYFEVYFAYRLLPASYVEISAGAVNHGTVRVQEHSFNDIGNLLLYPLLVQFKVYPLSLLGSKLQPYVGAGGGFYFGRRTVQFTNNYSSLYGYGLDSETDFNYVISGGVDWLFHRKFGLEFHTKYMPINFDRPLITINDYQALSFTIGVKYRY